MNSDADPHLTAPQYLTMGTAFHDTSFPTHSIARSDDGSPRLTDKHSKTSAQDAAMDGMTRHSSEMQHDSTSAPAHKRQRPNEKGPTRLVRPPNGFLLFNREMRKRLKDANPHMKAGEISSELSQLWRNLPKDEKDRYLNAAASIKEAQREQHGEFMYIRRSKTELAETGHFAKGFRKRKNGRGEKRKDSGPQTGAEDDRWEDAGDGDGEEEGESLGVHKPEAIDETQPSLDPQVAPSESDTGRAAPLQNQTRGTLDPPKHPLSGFFHFLIEQRSDVMKDYPGMTVGKVSQIVSSRWNRLTEEQRKPYHDKADLDKKRYAREMEEYADANEARMSLERNGRKDSHPGPAPLKRSFLDEYPFAGPKRSRKRRVSANDLTPTDTHDDRVALVASDPYYSPQLDSRASMNAHSTLEETLRGFANDSPSALLPQNMHLQSHSDQLAASLSQTFSAFQGRGDLDQTLTSQPSASDNGLEPNTNIMSQSLSPNPHLVQTMNNSANFTILGPQPLSQRESSSSTLRPIFPAPHPGDQQNPILNHHHFTSHPSHPEPLKNISFSLSQRFPEYFSHNPSPDKHTLVPSTTAASAPSSIRASPQVPKPLQPNEPPQITSSMTNDMTMVPPMERQSLMANDMNTVELADPIPNVWHSSVF